MIFASTSLGIQIDYGPNEPGMILQRQERAGWTDYLVEGRPVVSPFNVESLPSGRYWLVAKITKNLLQ
jgi:hypothetical protein